MHLCKRMVHWYKKIKLRNFEEFQFNPRSIDPRFRKGGAPLIFIKYNICSAKTKQSNLKKQKLYYFEYINYYVIY